MAIVNTLKIYEELKNGLDEKQAKVVAEAIEKSLEEYKENQKEFLVTKTEFKETISNLRAELKEDTSNLRAELKEDTSNLRAELIKWMFIFWVGQFAAIVGTLTAILFAFFRK